MARSSPITTAVARAWFPFALIVLLLLAIPGVILFVLNLLGLESAVNPWLQDHWHLSYHIPIPWPAGLIVLLVPVFILLLYFLKLKRKPLQVPSTFLWKKSIEDLHVNSLFQWLRENVLLLLQILTVLVLLYALMSFQIHGNMVEGKHYILMIDNSASMSATDVPPSRLDTARKEALKEIDAHTDNDTGMVIVFNSSAEILQSYTRDRSLLRRAVESIQPTQRTTRLEEALSLADSLANPTRSTDDAASRPAGEDPAKARTYVATEGMPTEVFLYSDGRFPDVTDFNLGNLSVEYHAMGEGSDNVGIVTLNAARDDRDPGRLLVFAQVANYRVEEARVQVDLEVFVNGQLKDIYKPQADAGDRIEGRKTVPVDESKPDGPRRDAVARGTFTFVVSDVDDRADVVMHAKLKDNKDKFPLDDEAWLVVGVIRKARVLVVGSGNKPLEAFFDHPATQKVAAVTYLEPAALKDAQKYLQPAREGAWDLVVFDRCAPEKEDDLPAANTWFIDEVPPPWKKADIVKDKANVLNAPPIKGSLEKSPLMRYLAGLHEIGIDTAFRFDLADERVPPRTPRLLESDRNTALLFTLSRQSYTDLVQTFAIMSDDGRFNTNWPLLANFPLFLRNVTYVLGNVNDAAGEERVQPGDVKTLRPDMAVKTIEVVGPAGKDGLPEPGGKAEKVERKGRPDFSFGNTERVGVYEVRWDGKPQRNFAINLLDADESNIEPRSEIRIGQDGIKAGQSRGTPRDTWKWVALGALGLLLLEWYIYNRRVYIWSAPMAARSFLDYRRFIQGHYDGPAGALTSVTGMLTGHEALAGRLIRPEGFDVRGSRRILDAGCGNGRYSRFLLKHADPGALITAFDLSPRMLHRAQRRLASDRITFAVADLTRLPYPDGLFDAAVCGWVLEHLPDPRLGLRELARVLCPGGRLLLLTTEDNFTGRWCGRLWHCRTYRRAELKQVCADCGLRWGREMFFSRMHARLGIGGIIVELHRAGPLAASQAFAP